ncbi:MAG: hypothetical protein U0W40_15280 [Acidimicrobiia bacterium]
MCSPRRLVALLLVSVAVGTITIATPGPVGAQTSARRCNGLAILCNRTAGDVAFPTSHNSMSSPADHFRGPNQGRPMSWQLDHGIRGFQIDAYLGIPTGNRVFTVFTGPLTEAQQDMSPTLLALGKRLNDQLGREQQQLTTPTDVYLCHTFCELGYVTMADELAVVRQFLDAHPREVLQIVIQDYVPPDRLRAQFDAAGLGSELATFTLGQPLPTLGQMIDAGTRLLVSLENGDGGPQLPNAFTGLVEETPFTFLTANQLRGAASCRDNRGVPGSPVFQLNHWVTPPVRSHAEAANRLLASRTSTCQRVRDRVPTLVAVDFADRSNVVAVARAVNLRS